MTKFSFRTECNKDRTDFKTRIQKQIEIQDKARKEINSLITKTKDHESALEMKVAIFRFERLEGKMEGIPTKEEVDE